MGVRFRKFICVLFQKLTRVGFGRARYCVANYHNKKIKISSKCVPGSRQRKNAVRRDAIRSPLMGVVSFVRSSSALVCACIPQIVSTPARVRTEIAHCTGWRPVTYPMRGSNAPCVVWASRRRRRCSSFQACTGTLTRSQSGSHPIALSLTLSDLSKFTMC